MLHGHVDILELEPLGNAIALVLGGDVVQPSQNGRAVRFGDDPLLAEHGSMRLRSRDVLAPQALVESDRRVDARHQLVRLGFEPAAPRAL